MAICRNCEYEVYCPSCDPPVAGKVEEIADKQIDQKCINFICADPYPTWGLPKNHTEPHHGYGIAGYEDWPSAQPTPKGEEK